MTSALQAMQVSSWTRLLTFGLAIEPELVGKIHGFTFEGFSIELALPNVYDDGLPSKRERVAHRTSYRQTPEGEIPIEICVDKIDVRVSIPDVFSLPAEILEQPCCAYELISKEQQEHLYERAEFFGHVSSRAYSYWCDVLRWVTRNGTLVRPGRDSVESGWSTYLEERTSKHRIWSERRMITVMPRDRLTAQEWATLGLVVASGVSVPTHWLYLLEAQYLSSEADIRRAVIDCALALESFLRSELENALSHVVPSHFRERIRRARLMEMLSTKMFDAILGGDFTAEVEGDLLSHLRPLVESRNRLVHGGLTLSDPGELYRWIEALRYLFSSFERKRNRFAEFGFAL